MEKIEKIDQIKKDIKALEVEINNIENLINKYKSDPNTYTDEKGITHQRVTRSRENNPIYNAMINNQVSGETAHKVSRTIRENPNRSSDFLYDTLQQNDIDPDTITRILDEIKDFQYQHPEGINVFQEGSPELTEMSRTIRDLSSNLVDAAVEGKNLGDVLQNMVKKFTTQIASDMIYFAIWTAITGGAGGATTAGTGIFGKSFVSQLNKNITDTGTAEKEQIIHLKGDFKIQDKELVATIDQYYRNEL